jgi:hypothetical protein
MSVRPAGLSSDASKKNDVDDIVAARPTYRSKVFTYKVTSLPESITINTSREVSGGLPVLLLLTLTQQSGKAFARSSTLTKTSPKELTSNEPPNHTPSTMVHPMKRWLQRGRLSRPGHRPTSRVAHHHAALADRQNHPREPQRPCSPLRQSTLSRRNRGHDGATGSATMSTGESLIAVDATQHSCSKPRLWSSHRAMGARLRLTPDRWPRSPRLPPDRQTCGRLTALGVRHRI